MQVNVPNKCTLMTQYRQIYIHQITNLVVFAQVYLPILNPIFTKSQLTFSLKTFLIKNMHYTLQIFIFFKRRYGIIGSHCILDNLNMNSSKSFHPNLLPIYMGIPADSRTYQCSPPDRIVKEFTSIKISCLQSFTNSTVTIESTAEHIRLIEKYS